MPVRIDLFGDKVESIRPFDPATQRSEGEVDGLVICAPRDDSGQAAEAPFFKHLLQMDYWLASLLKRVERLGLGNIEDIETTFRNLEFRDSQLLALLRRRKETLLNQTTYSI